LIAEMQIARPLKNQAFISSVDLVLAVDEGILLLTGFSQPQNCTGEFTYRSCSLRSAMGEYDVTIDGNTTSFDTPGVPRIVALANNTVVNTSVAPSETHPSTLAGLASIANDRWQRSIQICTVNGKTSALRFGGVYLQFQKSPRNARCSSFEDPYSTILNSMNRLMIYPDAYAAKSSRDALEGKLHEGLEVNTTITGRIEGFQSVFHTEFGFFIAAALVEFICIALVLPTYWGRWTLGRRVSFSPLEMAKVGNGHGRVSHEVLTMARPSSRHLLGNYILILLAEIWPRPQANCPFDTVL
jgi:hypothetical protein